MDERALRELRELERRDDDLALRIERLRSLDEEVAAVRARAEAIDSFFAAYPSAETRLREASTAAAEELDARRAELAKAEALLERAKGDAVIGAEHAVARAHDHIAVAEARVARAAAERDELEHAASALPEELPGLASRAAAVGEGAAPDDAPQALIEWASRAHASIFAALAQLDEQRARLIHEANELATMLLGEPTYGSTPAQARARVEARG
jgi:chromosome segregation ATPase